VSISQLCALAAKKTDCILRCMSKDTVNKLRKLLSPRSGYTCSTEEPIKWRQYKTDIDILEQAQKTATKIVRAQNI